MKVMFLLFYLFFCSVPQEQNSKENTEVEYGFSEKEMQILNNINQYREERNLSTLQLDEYLSSKCLNHNQTMISLGQLTHIGFEYRSSQIKASFPTTKVGECLSYNYQNPLIGWLDSPPHKEIIETENYNYIGISFKDGYCTIILVR